MNTTFSQLESFGADVLKLFLASSTAENTAIRTMSSAQDGSDVKTLMVVGSVHRDFADGNCIVILNPDESLVGQIKSGVAYHPRGLKRVVANRCDAMLQMNLIGQRSQVVGRYRARRGRSVTFAVK
jgi:hypothetical protein